MNPILTIGITSYNRINELVRCIKSIKTKYIEEIEVLISEDKSPLSLEIKKTVEDLNLESELNICFTSNDVNLGYDMNLGSIIKKSRGDYVFFMSDDDIVNAGCLDEIIESLKRENTWGVLYSPFIYFESGKKDRVRGKNHTIPSGEKSAANLIYDSILFSGLIFRKEYVCEYDASRFKNINYFQVYLFLQMILHHGGYYFENPSVVCIGDGENAYGISESSGGNELLANRKSIKSNLEFNKTLIKAIRMFDEDEDTHIIDSFAKQYSLHSISGLTIARREGRQYFEEYWTILNSLDIKLYSIVRCYYILLNILGAEKTTKLLSGFRRIMKKE